MFQLPHDELMTEHLHTAKNTEINPCRIWKSTFQAPCAAEPDIPPCRGCTFLPVVMFYKASMSPKPPEFPATACDTLHVLCHM